VLSPVHATGYNGSSYVTEPLDMPESRPYPIPDGKLFDMDDEEDLYGEARAVDKNGKHTTKGNDPSKCAVQ
jgi:hypothetical protein